MSMRDFAPIGPIGRNPLSARTVRDRRGFTLLESLIVIAIIGILAGLTIAALQVLIPRWRLQDAGNQLDSLIKRARRIAIDKQRTVVIRFEDDAGAMVLLTDMNQNTVYTLVANDGVRDVGKAPLYVLASGVDVSAITFAGEQIGVDELGQAAGTGEVTFSYPISPTRRRFLTVSIDTLSGITNIEEGEI